MVIGVTGGIASGKSLVSSELARFGGLVIDVDHVARELVEPGQPALEAIIKEFGAGFRQRDGTLDRRSLGKLVFSDPEALDRLNRIMFPRMRQVASERIREATRQHSLVVVDAAVLYEAGMDKLVDRVIVVTASEAKRVARIMARDRLTQEEALARVKAQTGLEEKARRADFVVDNSGSLEETREQVDRVLKQFGIATHPDSENRKLRADRDSI
ncbi:MAG: dephospho-CoA kinase [Bacillota bacterium]